MKFGVRKPSIKKSIKARTTGRAKRAVKKAVVPGYGKKGSGWVKNPKKAMYNKVYNKTTVSVTDLAKSSSKSSKSSKSNTSSTVKHKEVKVIKSVTLVNDDGGRKVCKLGYSWTTLIFPILAPLFKGDYRSILVQFLLLFVLNLLSPIWSFIIWVMYAGLYSRIYIIKLMQKGYRPLDEGTEAILKSKNFQI